MRRSAPREPSGRARLATVALLPPVGAGDRAKRLPLLAGSCQALVSLLLAEPADRAPLLAEVCRVDPALAVWCRAKLQESAESRDALAAVAEAGRGPTFARIAAAVAPDLLRHLAAGGGVRVGSLSPRAVQQFLDEASRAPGQRTAATRSGRAEKQSTKGAGPVGAPLDPSAESPVALVRLVGHLTRLDELESRFDQTLEAAKLMALVDFAAGAGHEINNPLANISGRAQTLLREETQPDRRQRLAAIVAQAHRAHEMISDLMLFARPPRPTLERLDLAAVASAAVESLRGQAEAQQTRLALTLPAELFAVMGDRTQMVVALQALVRNALEAVASSGEVIVAIERAQLADGSRVGGGQHAEAAAISVSDTGPGVSPEARPHLFNPFYSGREAGRGLGFGLCKAWRIAELHGGRIDVDASPAGSRFTLTLPAANQPAANAY